MRGALVAGAIVPHAPVLVLDTTRADIRDAARRIAEALHGAEIGDSDIVVLVSSHASRPGVYTTRRGGLEAFGVHELGVTVNPDLESAHEVARLWDEPLIDRPLDHGVVVPLLIRASFGAPMVAVGLPEAGDLSSMVALLDAARGLASAIEALASSQRVAVVVSGHTAAALSPAAPLMELPEGHELDSAVVDALAGEPGELCDIPAELWLAGGACGAGVLSLFGALFRRRPVKLLAHESPAGVGWIVAQA